MERQSSENSTKNIYLYKIYMFIYYKKQNIIAGIEVQTKYAERYNITPKGEN